MSMTTEILIEAIEEGHSITHVEWTVLNGLARSVGIDVGFMQVCGIGTDPSWPTTLGFDPGIRERLINPIYEKELQPVKQRARATGGLAVDIDVLRDPSQYTYWQDLVRPYGKGYSLLAYLTVQGQDIGGFMLGRYGRGFTNKELVFLKEAIPFISAGVRAIRAEQALRTLQKDLKTQSVPLPDLSDRERDILDYLRLGYSNQQIASALGTSSNTVRNQLARIYFKLDVCCRTEAVAVLLSSQASFSSKA